MGECAQLLLEQCALSGDVERLRKLADIAQWQQIGQLAIEDGVAGLMYWHCAKSELALPARVERQWQHLYRSCAGANLAALCRLEQVLALFYARGIDALLLPVRHYWHYIPTWDVARWTISICWCTPTD